MVEAGWRVDVISLPILYPQRNFSESIFYVPYGCFHSIANRIVLDLILDAGHHGTMRPSPILILLACAASIVCIACTATASAPAKPQAPDAGDTLAKIRALIGAAACTDGSQCHTLALGARPCGGPQAYLPWSSASTDRAALAVLGEQFRKERAAAIAASGEMSDCRFLPDPGAVCRAGTCQLNPPNLTGQSAI